MKQRLNIPYEWNKYRNIPAYFITYFGEIYFGTLWEHDEFPEGFFIIQNDKIKGVKKDGSLINFKKSGREIKDVNVIKEIHERDFGRDNPIKSHTYSNDQHFKRMFVFGAAASTYCVFGKSREDFRHSTMNPPSGIELFDGKYNPFLNKYSGAKLSIPLVEAKGKDVEGCMEEEWQLFKSGYNPQVANRHLNIQFYLSELFKEVSKGVIKDYSTTNLYSLFLNKIQKHVSKNSKEKISLVTFNYDTILDDFASQIFSIPFEKMEDYINYSEQNILLFKPHGSCNWGWKFNKDKIKGHTQNSIANALFKQKVEPWQVYFQLLGELNEVIAKNSWGIEYFNDKNFRGRLTINKNLIELINEGGEDVFLPALLMPYRDKDEMIMPYDHSFVMRYVVENIEEIYFIGWKGNENHFNTELKRARRLKKIVIVNPNEKTKKEVSKNLYEYLGDIYSKYEVEVIEDFESFVLNDFEGHLT